MKKLISVLMSLVIVSSLFASFAVTTNAAQESYVSELKLASAFEADTAKTALQQDGFTLINYDESADDEGDLKNGAGVVYVYLGYKSTNDANNAIRDIIVLIGSEYGYAENWVNPANNCTYYPVNGKATDDEGHVSNAIIDVNITGKYYIYYTKDINAGNPITDLTVSEEETTDKNAVLRSTDGKRVDLNKSWTFSPYMFIYYNQQKYFSSLQLGYGESEEEAEAQSTTGGYRLLIDDQGEDGALSLKYHEGDTYEINTDYYIYMSYVLTGNTSNAIYDIRFLAGSQYSNISEWVCPQNNCVYTPVGGYINGTYVTNFNPNYNSGVGEYYIFVSTDPNSTRNSVPVIDIDLRINSNYKLNSYEVKDQNGNAFNSNQGLSDLYVYIFNSYTSSTYGSMFALGDNSIVIIAVCGVIIVAVGVILALRKKKQTNASA